jgi:hypothetical protein
MIPLNQLVDLAKESESQISFDWSEIQVSKEDAYRLMALHCQEMDDDPIMLKACLVSLLVENMVLHVQLLKNGVS